MAEGGCVIVCTQPNCLVVQKVEFELYQHNFHLTQVKSSLPFMFFWYCFLFSQGLQVSRNFISKTKISHKHITQNRIQNNKIIIPHKHITQQQQKYKTQKSKSKIRNKLYTRTYTQNTKHKP